MNLVINRTAFNPIKNLTDKVQYATKTFKQEFQLIAATQ